MKRALFTTVLALGLAVPAFADVTIKQTTGGKGLGMSGTTPGDDLHQGQQDAHRRRQSATRRRRRSSTSTRRRCTCSTRRRRKPTCGTWRAFAQELSQSVDTSSIKGSFKPNGQTKQIAGQTATGYDMEISVTPRWAATRT